MSQELIHNRLEDISSQLSILSDLWHSGEIHVSSVYVHS